MVRKNSQSKDKELERLIKQDIREMKKVIKDKGRQQAVEDNIRRDMEYENSLEGALHHLKIWGEATTDGEKNKCIIAETLLKLPYKVRRKTLDEVIFVIVTAKGMTTKMALPVELRKEDIRKSGETYHATVEHPLVFLNFKSRPNKSRKMDMIAHEVAHFMHGHHEIPDRAKQKENINERKADDLSEKWGFKRCYKDYNF